MYSCLDHGASKKSCNIYDLCSSLEFAVNGYEQDGFKFISYVIFFQLALSHYMDSAKQVMFFYLQMEIGELLLHFN